MKDNYCFLIIKGFLILSMSILSYLSSIAGVSMGLSSIPQIARIFTLRSANDVSKTTHVVLVNYPVVFQ